MVFFGVLLLGCKLIIWDYELNVSMCNVEMEGIYE